MKSLLLFLFLVSSISAYASSVDELEDYCWDIAESSSEVCQEQKEFLALAQEIGDISEMRIARMALRSCQKAAVQICIDELIVLN